MDPAEVVVPFCRNCITFHIGADAMPDTLYIDTGCEVTLAETPEKCEATTLRRGPEVCCPAEAGFERSSARGGVSEP